MYSIGPYPRSTVLCSTFPIYYITLTKNCVIKPVDLGGETGTAVVLVATCELLKSIMFKIYGQYHTLINDFAANDHEQ